MKYSFMTFSTPELSFDQVLATARQFGYDGVELRISAGQQHGMEFDTPAAARAEARQKAADSGVAICCVATSCRYADPAIAAAMVDATRRSIDLAGDLGAPCIRVFGGGLAAGLSREDAVALVADSLASVAEQAASRGVTVCLETHDDWCDPRNIAAVISRVNHPAIAVNWDIMHPVRTRNASIEESFEILKPWIRHLHLHDGEMESGKLLPIGTGAIDHKRAIELLLTVSYQGFLSGEWIGWEPYEIHLPRELAILRRYEAEAAVKA